MLLILGNSTEPVESVVQLVRKAGLDVLQLKTDRCLDGDSLGVMCINGKHENFLILNDKEVNLGAVKSVWYLKPHLPKILRTYNPADYRYFIYRQFNSLWHSVIYTLADRNWVSSYDRVLAAENKSYQLKVASDIGFVIPDTIITSDPQKVLDFWHFCQGEVVIKMLASSPIDDKVIFTSLLLEEHLPKLAQVRSSPSIFQRKVAKQVELRITVVGNSIFAAEIDSQHCEGAQGDWRRQTKGLNVRATDIPSHLKSKCLQLVASLRLRFGCIDMILTPTGEYVFLEINPNGQWYWVERETGMPISQAVADLLIGA